MTEFIINIIKIYIIKDLETLGLFFIYLYI